MILEVSKDLELAALPEGFLMRPVVAGLVDYAVLDDPATHLDLASFAEMNEALDVEAYNRMKLDESAKRG